MPRRISAEEAERAQEKHDFIRGHKVVVTEEAERLHDEIHGTHTEGKRAARAEAGEDGDEEGDGEEDGDEEVTAASQASGDRRRSAAATTRPPSTRRRWPEAALCAAEDLTASGWLWSSADGEGGRDRLGRRRRGRADTEVTGVFVRRSTVYPDELTGTHPDDRAYLAAEAHAFLVYVLATTRAVVVNPVSDGTLGVDALRPEQWMRVAAALGCGRRAASTVTATSRRRRAAHAT